MKTINIRKTFYIQSSVWRRGDRTARIIKILRLVRNCVCATYDEAITNPKITKEWWQNALREQINLLNRKEEIERGEFI